MRFRAPSETHPQFETREDPGWVTVAFNAAEITPRPSWGWARRWVPTPPGGDAGG